MKKLISHNDKAYHQWCAENPQGFILNIRSYVDTYGVLHKVGCSSLKHISNNHPEPFTGNMYRKVVSNDFNELDDVYIERQEKLGLAKIYLAYRCKKCNPD